MYLAPPSVHTFSTEVHLLLEEAGWQPGRRGGLQTGNAGAIVLRWPPVLESFLEEFGALRLYFFRQDGSLGRLHFDASLALQHTDPTYLQQQVLPRLPGRALFVIGHAYTENLLLLMDEHGVVYGAYEEFLYHIADSGPLAIEAICRDLVFTEIE